MKITEGSCLLLKKPKTTLNEFYTKQKYGSVSNSKLKQKFGPIKSTPR